MHVCYSNKKFPNLKTVERIAYENGVKTFESVKAGGFGFVDNSLQNKVHSHTFRNYSPPIPKLHKLKCQKKMTRGKQNENENIKYLVFLRWFLRFQDNAVRALKSKQECPKINRKFYN